VTSAETAAAQQDALLATKLHVPVPWPGLVPRPRLAEALDGGLAAGRPNQAIAAELVVTLDTVKKHVGHVLAKLGAANRHHAGSENHLASWIAWET